MEDPLTGNSFRFPGGLKWSVYVEVPSYELNIQPEDSLALFLQAIPTLDMLGTHQVLPKMQYTVDEEVQLVCKYLNAYKNAGDLDKGIDRLYKEGLFVCSCLSVYTSLNREMHLKKKCWNHGGICAHILCTLGPELYRCLSL